MRTPNNICTGAANTGGGTGPLIPGLAGLDSDRLACIARQNDADFMAACVAVVDALDADFRAEEAIMEHMAYAALPAHREQHARLQARLHKAMAKLMQGELAPARTAMKALPRWFALHTTSMDLALAEAILRKPESAGVPAPG